MKKKKDLTKYGVGGFFKKAYDYGHDAVLGNFDNTLTAIGMGNVLDKSAYNTDLGRKADSFRSKIIPGATVAAATAFGGPAGGAIASGLQTAGGAVNPQDAGARQPAAEQQQLRAEELLRRQRQDNMFAMSPSSQGVNGSGYYAMGGQVTEPYEVEQGEIVQGTGVELEEGEQHASDIHEVGGESHENGGTEGMGGERVFSDRLKPVGSKKTYAELAADLGKLKGKHEEKAESHNEFTKNTGTRMSTRADRLLDNLFNTQEASKVGTGSTAKYALGGTIDPKNRNAVLGMQERLKRLHYYNDKIDGDWGPNSQKAYAAYQQRNGADFNRVSTPTMDMSLRPAPNQNYQPIQPLMPRVGGRLGANQPQQDFVPLNLQTNLMNGKMPGMAPPAMGSVAAMKPGVAPAGTAVPATGVTAAQVGNVAGAVAPYVDNIVNAFIEPPKPYAPQLVGAPQLNTQVDVNPELAQMNTNQRLLNSSIDSSTTNSAVARANKVAAYVGNVGQAGQLYGTKRREETALTNQQAMLNSQAENTNAGMMNQYRDKLTARESERLGMISANAANASMDMQGQTRDKNLMENDLLKFKLVADRYRASGVLNRKEAGTLLQAVGGNKERAASILGISVAKLDEQLAKAQ